MDRLWRAWRTRSVILITLLMTVHLDSLAEVKQHDLVIMKNWDHLTGHVKKLESGVLYIDLDYVSGSLGVDWLELEKVESAVGFPVLLRMGTGCRDDQ